MPSSSTGHVALDIDTLLKSIDQAILVEKKKSANVFDITIYKDHDRAAGENDYTPQYVPIGPYHRGRLPSQQRTEEEKLRILMGVLDLDEMGTQEEGATKNLVNLRTVLDKIREQEKDARACYADRFDEMEVNEFVQMLLFDGCYLLVYFVDNTKLKAPAAPGKDESMVRDSFYLLENQIPFSVLERIYVSVFGNADEGHVLRKLTVYVQTLLQERFYIGPPGDIAKPYPNHLLHLVHQHFTLRNTEPTQPNDGANNQQTQANNGMNNQSTKKNDGTGRWRRATEYCSHANVRFKQRVFDDDKEWSVLDVELDNGTLWMPRLRIDKNTWTILRNLMALEKLPKHLMKKPNVTAYCLFMSQVACTAEDVELLGSAGVVEHFLGSDAEAAQGFTNLCDGVALEIDDLSSNYLQPTWQKLDSRCKSCTHFFFGWFRQKHCRNPYYFAAFVVAVIVSASAVLQAVIAVMEYMK